MPTLIKMGNVLGTTQESGEKKQYVNLGLVVLVSVLIVIVIFIVMKCKLKCGSTREAFIRTISSNDTQGTGYGYLSPVDYAGPSSPDIGWPDSPHYKADPSNKYLPCDMAPVDFERSLRRVSDNFLIHPNSTLPPLGWEFSQHNKGARAPDYPRPGEISVGKPMTNQGYKTRKSYLIRGYLPTSRALNNQPQQGNLLSVGMDYKQQLNLRKFDQLNYHQDAPNASILPGLTKYNRIMDNVIQRDLDLIL